jgi:hypothetical protein
MDHDAKYQMGPVKLILSNPYEPPKLGTHIGQCNANFFKSVGNTVPTGCRYWQKYLVNKQPTSVRESMGL